MQIAFQRFCGALKQYRAIAAFHRTNSERLLLFEASNEFGIGSSAVDEMLDLMNLHFHCGHFRLFDQLYDRLHFDRLHFHSWQIVVVNLDGLVCWLDYIYKQQLS